MKTMKTIVILVITGLLLGQANAQDKAEPEGILGSENIYDYELAMEDLPDSSFIQAANEPEVIVNEIRKLMVMDSSEKGTVDTAIMTARVDSVYFLDNGLHIQYSINTGNPDGKIQADQYNIRLKVINGSEILACNNFPPIRIENKKSTSLFSPLNKSIFRNGEQYIFSTTIIDDNTGLVLESKEFSYRYHKSSWKFWKKGYLEHLSTTITDTYSNYLEVNRMRH